MGMKNQKQFSRTMPMATGGGTSTPGRTKKAAERGTGVGTALGLLLAATPPSCSVSGKLLPFSACPTGLACGLTKRILTVE